MKKSLAIVLLASAGLFCVNCKSSVANTGSNSNDATGLVIPEDVQAVVDHSCYGCHNTEAKNEKGRDKLDFDKLGSLKTFALVGALSDIQKAVEADEMPPEKFLEKYPDHALTEDQKKTLVSWAKETGEKLAGE